MQFALVNGFRSTAKPKSLGICQFCGDNMIAKCGLKTIWHWAHSPKRKCDDPWWENETPWHRKWKSYFPEAWREFVGHDPTTGERHIADVKTDTGRVLEFQNSDMPPNELQSRESFYGDMIWIVNGEKFLKNFHVLDRLPAPEAAFSQDIVFRPQRVDWLGRPYWRLSENPDHVFGSGGLVLMHCMSEIEEQINQEYDGHHLFDWKRPRTVWFESRKQVYFDLGSDEHLLQVKIYRIYGGRPLWCIQYLSKQVIIESNGGTFDASERAT